MAVGYRALCRLPSTNLSGCKITEPHETVMLNLLLMTTVRLLTKNIQDNSTVQNRMIQFANEMRVTEKDLIFWLSDE